ncbi:MAG: UbiA prenyltransferase family protein [Kofleriaceae bacterium]
MSPWRALLRTVRPHQWVKNLFVAAPLVFSRHLQDAAPASRTAIAVLCFCLLSGAVYAFNDVRDVDADRAHPEKRERPIAAGHLRERTALWAAAALAALALGGCLALSWKLAAFAAAYGAVNLAYSLKLKHVAFVDVALIAGGFVLRVLGGAAAIDVRPSLWLLLCTSLLAAMLALGKRAHELSWAARSASTGVTRAALAGYRLPVVRVAVLALGVATAVAYVLYCLSPHTRAFFRTDDLIFTAPFPALGVARFAFLSLGRPGPQSPTDAMLRDKLFVANVLAWASCVVWIVYRAR